MYKTVVLDGDCELIVPGEAEVSLTETMDGECGVITRIKAADYYTGETEITPSEYTQTLKTTGLLVPSNIIVKPIPSNWGKITYDGSVLTVS